MGVAVWQHAVMSQDIPHFTPQLCMWRRSLNGLPDIALPEGYTIRASRAGDGTHWARIMRESFQDDRFDEARFQRDMVEHPAYRPERIFFVCAADGVPCGTASAYRQTAYGPDSGYLHYVGVCPAHAGKGLGAAISLRVLQQFRAEGLRDAVLQTDDFRLPAIKTYLTLGFVPMIIHVNQPARWATVFAKLGLSSADGAIGGP